MTASLRVCGMCPHIKEALTIFSSGVPITCNSSFRSFVGIGSRRRVEDFDEFTMVLNSMRSIEAKEFRWATLLKILHPSEWMEGWTLHEEW